jgi:hypothetical protein
VESDNTPSTSLLDELAKYGITPDKEGYLYKRQVELARTVESEIAPLLQSIGLPRATTEPGGMISSAGWSFTIPPSENPALVIHWYPTVEESSRLIQASEDDPQEWERTGRIVSAIRAMEAAVAEILRKNSYQVDEVPSEEGTGIAFEVRIPPDQAINEAKAEE